MITFKQLADFIEKNNNILDKDSLFLIIHDDKFTFIRNDFSYLNIEGSYDFFINGEKAFTGMKHGDISTTWSMTEGTFKANNGGNDGLFNITYNMVFDRDTFFMTLEEYEKTSKEQNINKDSGMVNVGFKVNGTAFWTIDTVKIIETPSLSYRDSYGHQKNKNYKYNCIGLVLGTEVTQKFRINEKVIYKYGDFMKNKY